MLKERCAWNRPSALKAGLFAPCLTSAVLAAMLVLLSTSNAAAQSTTVEFNIPAQPISSALRAYAHQAKVQLLVMTEGLNTIEANEVVGRLDPRTALQMLLAGTGLHAEYRPDATIAVGRGSATEGPLSSAGGDARDGQANWFAQAGQEVDEAVTMAQAVLNADQTSRSTETDSGKVEYKRPLEEIIVTGTNIRGIAPESSPVRTFTREDIQITGAATAEQFIQTLTTNFGGGSNPNTGLPTDPSSGGNSGSFGSFGSSVNLRGLGSGSTLVLLNGHRVAPASFNGDFIDISMIPASAIERVDVLTDGASSIYGSDAVAGVVNFILRDDFDGLETSLRAGTGTQNRTPDQYRTSITGGTNWDSGHALVVYELFDQDHLSVEDRDFTAKDFSPSYLLPSQERHSVLTSATQDLTANFTISADLSYSDRKAHRLRTSISGLASRTFASSKNLNVSIGGDWGISRDWFFDFSGVYSKLDTRNLTSSSFDDFRVTNSDIRMADVKISGPLFPLPGGDVKLAVGAHYRAESFLAVNKIADTVDREATRDVYALFGEAFIPIVGPVNRVAGIERLELNVSSRFSDYSDFGSTTNPKVGLLWSPLDSLRLRGSYSTSFRAPPLGLVGATDFGASALNTSFINARLGLTAPDPSLENAVILNVAGTGKDLGPETSSAFTAGLDFHQQWGAHDVALSGSWFDIDFEGRLGSTPIPGNAAALAAVNIAFIDPSAFPQGTVVFSPTAAEISALLDTLDIFVNPFGDDPLDAVAINFTRVIRNLSQTVARGFDFQGSYTYDLDHGSLLLGLNGTVLRDLTQQVVRTTPSIEQVNTLFNPVDLKLRGRAGYSVNNFTANVFVNYVDSYRENSTPSAESIASWTTVDLSFAYDAKDSPDTSLLDNTAFRLSVTNLFENDPPKTPFNSNVTADGFDPTNASPLGRYISFEITKRW